MGKVQEVFALLITADGKQAVSELGRVGNTTDAELGKAGAAAKRFHGETLAMAAGVAAAGATTLAVLKSTSDAYIQNGRDVIKLQRSTGLAAQDASKLTYAAGQSGIGVDRLSTAVVRLSKSAGTAGGATALRTLGVSMTDASGKARPIADVFNDVADSLSRLEGGQQKNNLVTTLFGRGGTELLPLLNKGSAGIKELGDQAQRLGLTFTDQDIARVKEAIQAQKDLAAARKGLSNVIGREVTPFIDEIDTKIANAAKAGVEVLAKLPAGLKSVLAGGAVVGSAGASALGGVGTVALGFNQAAEASSRVRQALDAGSVSVAGIAKGGLAAASAAVTWGFAVSEAADQYERAHAMAQKVITDQDVIAAFDPTKNRVRSTATAFASALAFPDTSPQTFFDRAASILPGGWSKNDRNRVAADNVRDSLKEISSALSSLPAGQARQLLDEVATVLRAMGKDGESALGKLRPLYKELDRRDSAERAIAGFNGVSGAMDNMGNSAERNTNKLVGTQAGIETLIKITDGTKKLMDLRDQETKAATSNSREVMSSYEGVIRAQQRLNDLLEDQKDLYGQISPEEGIRRAREQLQAANDILAKDPRNSTALTQKDEALARIDSESARRQEITRTEKERARAIRDAQQSVTDAKQSYDDAVQKNRDMATSAGDAVQSQYDLKNATNDLAVALANGSQSAGTLRAELERLYNSGVITKQQFDQLNGSLEDSIRLAAYYKAVMDQAYATKPGEHMNTYPITSGGGGGGSSTPGGSKKGGREHVASAADLRSIGVTVPKNPKAGTTVRDKDGHVWTYDPPGRWLSTYHTGGVIPGSGPVDIRALGGEGVVSRNGMAALAAINSGRVLMPLGQSGAGRQSTAAQPVEVHEHLHLHEVASPRAAVDIYAHRKRQDAYLFHGVSRTSPRAG